MAKTIYEKDNTDLDGTVDLDVEAANMKLEEV